MKIQCHNYCASNKDIIADLKFTQRQGATTGTSHNDTRQLSRNSLNHNVLPLDQITRI